jgi:hypothetical protein
LPELSAEARKRVEKDKKRLRVSLRAIRIIMEFK